jgi:triose/dihydroxyacetone kinase / FAD-AMP lyase (cyclizing)
MLSAAVSGNIFASPSVAQILDAVHSVGGAAGTILIIKNYTGDILHFHLAAEKARALYGQRVEVLVVGDDVAVGRHKSGRVGRRGLAGTVLVHKVLGAMSAAGKSIEELLEVGKSIVNNLVTCGVSQGHVRIPGSDNPHSKDDQIELGMGIHNEPGCYVLDPRPSLSELLGRMLDLMIRNDDPDRGYVDFERVENAVLLVNNLGGTSVLELNAIALHVAAKLGKFLEYNIFLVKTRTHTENFISIESYGFKAARVISGSFMTSLNAAGFSLTLLNATSEMVAHIDGPTTAIGWPTSYVSIQPRTGVRVIAEEQSQNLESVEKKDGTGYKSKQNNSQYLKSDLP